MKYYSGKEIGEKVIEIEPNHIMVAYLGADWRRFVPKIEKVDRLIVQPNPPTNPRAIKDIVKIIGWEKIQFLDNLHAKVYLNLNADNESGKAIAGSPNLTANGLGGSGLYEAAVQFDFTKNQDGASHEIVESFREVWEKACAIYNTEESKKTRLEKLKEDSIKYSEIALFGKENSNRNVSEYKEWDSSFWPMFWNVIRNIEYEEEVQDLNDRGLIAASCCVSNEDQIVRDNLQNRWVLHWGITKTNRPRQRAKIEWIRVNKIYKNGNAETDSPYQAILIQDNNLTEKPPFLLDAKTEEAIKNILAKDEYKLFWEDIDKTGWKTQQVNDLMPRWLADVIQEYERLINQTTP